MSLFLAPIHSWLFNKIRLYEELEQTVIKSHLEIFGEDVNNIVNEGINKYGDFLEEKPLEDMIDLTNIHGWLQGRIQAEESRSAYVFGKLHEKYGQQSKEITIKESEKQATKCANNESGLESAEDVYATLNNYILEGMPCDRVNTVTEKDDNHLVYVQGSCIHRPNYELGQGNLEYMYDLRDAWVKSFIENLSPKYTYNIKREGEQAVHTITKA